MKRLRRWLTVTLQQKLFEETLKFATRYGECVANKSFGPSKTKRFSVVLVSDKQESIGLLCFLWCFCCKFLVLTGSRRSMFYITLFDLTTPVDKVDVISDCICYFGRTVPQARSPHKFSGLLTGSSSVH